MTLAFRDVPCMKMSCHGEPRVCIRRKTNNLSNKFSELHIRLAQIGHAYSPMAGYEANNGRDVEAS